LALPSPKKTTFFVCFFVWYVQCLLLLWVCLCVCVCVCVSLSLSPLSWSCSLALCH
jgi:hypothetical protein